MPDVYRVRRGEVALVGAYIEREMLTAIDTARGDRSRSEWLREAIDRHIEKTSERDHA